MKAIQIITTIDTEEKAKEIARELLNKRLAACVQVFPVSSSYRWKDKIENAHEWACVIKARAADYPKVETAIKSIHTYSVPEIVALPIIEGDKSYLKWLEEETRK
jgi:periplasmic divalent cation tolerance protein